ncbi:hypothetical protein BH09VER1_BH09VER1_43810 [soil metagenome]
MTDNPAIESSSLSDGGSSRPRRPVLVWIIALLYIIPTGAGIVLNLFLYSGYSPIKPEQLGALLGTSNFALLCWTLGTLLCLAGAGYLLGLSRHALPCFLGAWIAEIASVIHQSLTTDFWRLAGPVGLAVQLFGWAVTVAILFYCRSLIRRKVLR